jgi:hypothetical protein
MPVAWRGRAAFVAIQTWGRPEACQATAFLEAVGSLMPPPPPGAPGPFALSEPGALEDLASRAGLTAREAGEIATRWEYPGLDTALRGILSGGPVVKAIRTAGEERVVSAVTDAIAPFRADDGRYLIQNRWRHLLATA